MEKVEILKFVNKNPVFCLATSKNNIPRVRVMTVCFADENGIIFNTKNFKDSYQELKYNPCVEMCFYNAKEGIQIRISGEVKLVDDLEVKKEIVKNFSVLQTLVDKSGYEIIVPYCLKNWKAKIWRRENIHDRI